MFAFWFSCKGNTENFGRSQTCDTAAAAQKAYSHCATVFKILVIFMAINKLLALGFQTSAYYLH